MCQAECTTCWSATTALQHATFTTHSPAWVARAYSTRALAHRLWFIPSLTRREAKVLAALRWIGTTPWLTQQSPNSAEGPTQKLRATVKPFNTKQRIKQCPSIPKLLPQVLPNSNFIWIPQARCKPQVHLLPLIPTPCTTQPQASLYHPSRCGSFGQWRSRIPASLPWQPTSLLLGLLHTLP